MWSDDRPRTLWRVRKDGRWYECVTRFVPNGVEVELVCDGSPLHARIFRTGEKALAEAEQIRRQFPTTSE